MPYSVYTFHDYNHTCRNAICALHSFVFTYKHVFNNKCTQRHEAASDLFN